QLLIGCPHGAPGDAELDGEVLPRGQAGARLQHTILDSPGHSPSDLLRQGHLCRAVEIQIPRLIHSVAGTPRALRSSCFALRLSVRMKVKKAGVNSRPNPVTP